jgi:hypothetical protein
MTLTIDLTPEQESALAAEANARGLDLPEFARLRLLDGVPAPGAPGRRPTGRGMLKHLPGGSEAFAREKQEEIRREEAGWQK